MIDVKNLTDLLAESPDVTDVENALPIPLTVTSGSGSGTGSGPLLSKRKVVLTRCVNCKTEVDALWLFCPFCRVDLKNLDTSQVTKLSRMRQLASPSASDSLEDGIEMQSVGLDDIENSEKKSEVRGVSVDFKGVAWMLVVCAFVKVTMVMLTGVYFHYDQQLPSAGLQGITFHVAPGTTTALVGHTGAGKTTLSRLLFRFYDPLAGVVQFDGHDIKKFQQKSVRGAVGIVPQDTVLFNDTILYNIQYGRLDASIEEVPYSLNVLAYLCCIMGVNDRECY